VWDFGRLPSAWYPVLEFFVGKLLKVGGKATVAGAEFKRPWCMLLFIVVSVLSYTQLVSLVWKSSRMHPGSVTNFLQQAFSNKWQQTSSTPAVTSLMCPAGTSHRGNAPFANLHILKTWLSLKILHNIFLLV